MREVCDDQQTAAVALCVLQCGAGPNGEGAVVASSNCTDGDICALEAAFVLAQGCLFHDAPAKDVLEPARSVVIAWTIPAGDPKFRTGSAALGSQMWARF